MKTKIIWALAVLVLGLSGYLLYDSTQSEKMSEAQIQTQFNDLKTDYEFIQKDLENKMGTIDASNTLIVAQRKRIEDLMKKNSITEEELFEAKKLMREISQGVLNEFKKRIAHLEDEKVTITIDQQDKIKELELLNAQYKKLEASNKSISQKYSTVNTQYKTVRKESEQKDNLLNYASRITPSNFILKSFKIRNNGKEVETDKASKIDRIKVYFDISENKIAESGTKELFFVVTKPDGSLATFKNSTSGTFVSEGKQLTYSDKISFDYTKGSENTKELVWDSDDFGRGDYKLAVYEKVGQEVFPVGRATRTLD